MDGRPTRRNKAAFSILFDVVSTLLKLFFIKGGGGYVIVLVITLCIK